MLSVSAGQLTTCVDGTVGTIMREMVVILCACACGVARAALVCDCLWPRDGWAGANELLGVRPGVSPKKEKPAS